MGTTIAIAPRPSANARPVRIGTAATGAALRRMARGEEPYTPKGRPRKSPKTEHLQGMAAASWDVSDPENWKLLRAI